MPHSRIGWSLGSFQKELWFNPVKCSSVIGHYKPTRLCSTGGRLVDILKNKWIPSGYEYGHRRFGVILIWKKKWKNNPINILASFEALWISRLSFLYKSPILEWPKNCILESIKNPESRQFFLKVLQQTKPDKVSAQTRMHTLCLFWNLNGVLTSETMAQAGVGKKPSIDFYNTNLFQVKIFGLLLPKKNFKS